MQWVKLAAIIAGLIATVVYMVNIERVADRLEERLERTARKRELRRFPKD